MTSEELLNSDWGLTSFNFVDSNPRIRLCEINADKTESDQSEDTSYGNRNRSYSPNYANTTEHKDSFPSVEENFICSICLDDHIDDMNEILLCAGCGVSVHEQCYGVDDLNSESNSLSSNNTESCISEICENDSMDSIPSDFHPYYDDLNDISDATSICNFEEWFCEACKAGVTEVNCELCPNKGGIIRQTVNGKWVHLVCALYIPEVKFKINDHFISVNIFEIPFSRWGAEKCSLCTDDKFSSTGICISCEDEMCKTYFHVTCAQAAGLLLEMNTGDSVLFINNHTARCEVHSCKMAIERRKRNYNTIKEKFLSDEISMQRKLISFHLKHKVKKNLKIPPWIPKQKIPRLLTTSAQACRRLYQKTKIIGIEFQEIKMTEICKESKPCSNLSGKSIDQCSDKLNELKLNFQRQLNICKKRTLELQDSRRVHNLNTKLNINNESINAVLKRKLYKLSKQFEALGTNKIQYLTEDNEDFSRTLSNSSPISGPFAEAFKVDVNSFQTLPHTITEDFLKISNISNYHESNSPRDRNDLQIADKILSSKITPPTLRKRRFNVDLLENEITNRNEVKNMLVSNSFHLQTNKKPKVVLNKINLGNTVVNIRNKQKRKVELKNSNEKFKRTEDDSIRNENLFRWNKSNTIHNWSNSKYPFRNTPIRSNRMRDSSKREVSPQLS